MKLELNVQHFLKSTIQLYRTDIKIEEMQGHLVTTNVKAGILNSMVHSWVCTDYRFTTRAQTRVLSMLQLLHIKRKIKII